MKLFKAAIIALAVAVFVTPDAQADQVLFSDDFNSYTAGNLVPQGGWVAHSGAGTNPPQVNATGELLLTGNGEDVSHNVGAVMAAGEMWQLSFDVSVAGVGGGDTYFAHLKTATSGFNGRVFGLSPVAGGDFTFGIGDVSSSGANAVAFATDFNFNQTYTMNAVYDFDAGLTTLTVDGVVGSVVSSAPDTAQALQEVAFRQGSGSGDYTVDNVSVTSLMAVPEPGSLAFIGLGMLGFVARRRRS